MLVVAEPYLYPLLIGELKTLLALKQLVKLDGENSREGAPIPNEGGQASVCFHVLCWSTE